MCLCVCVWCGVISCVFVCVCVCVCVCVVCVVCVFVCVHFTLIVYELAHFHSKGFSYNIPVGIYLHKDYPYQCPYCQVQPTPDMMIAPSKYVNQQGVIFLPYLQDWNHVSRGGGAIVVGNLMVWCLKTGFTYFCVGSNLHTTLWQPFRPF